jgi:hypothetical protein
MKTFRLLVIAVFCGALASSCFNPPEYPDAPVIHYKSVSYVKGGTLDDGTEAADSIIVVLTFQDGNGDVGVGADEVNPPFNDRWYYTKQPLQHDNTLSDDCSQYKNMCWYINPLVSEFDKYLDIDDRKTSPYDSLPAFANPDNCTHWEVIYYDDDNNQDTPDKPLDTLYFAINRHYSNIFVEFQVKIPPSDPRYDPNNPFQKFDETALSRYPLCIVRSFDGRLPVLAEDLSHPTPLEGEIRYAMPSESFETLFGSQFIRLKIYIEDRALNESNTVYTEPFNLLENN